MSKPSNIASQTPAQFTLVYGNDSIGREKFREDYVSRIRELYPLLLEERFDSSREPFSSFVERMLTPSLFQETRIFHIRHFNELNKADATLLAEVLGMDPPDAFCCIEIDEAIVRKDSLRRHIQKLGIEKRVKKDKQRYHIVEFAKPPAYKIPQWLTDQVRILFNRTISKPNAEYLIELAGNELDALYSELQKIDIHLPAGAPIDKAAIRRITGATRTMSIYELARALGARNLAQALTILDSLFSSSFYAPTALAAIFNHFWALFRIHAYAKANRDKIREYRNKHAKYEVKNTIAHEVGVAAGLLGADDPVNRAYPVVILSGVIDQAAQFSEKQLKSIMQWLKDADVGVKTGRVDPSKAMMELLCYKIVRIGELEKDGYC
jgi:DNA polymerase III delta subunit